MSKSVEERQEEVKRLMGLVLHEIELMSVDEETTGTIISELVQREHRSNQQNFWRVMYNSQRHYGRYARVDHRNNSSRNWCNHSTYEIHQFPVL